MCPWQLGEVRIVAVADLGERYRRYRLGDAEAEAAMARSLLRYGQMAPLVVCLRETTVEVIDGFKRLAGARAGKLATLSARLVEADERTVLAAMYALNRAGRRVQELEEAWIVQALVRDLGLTQVEAAELLGRHKSWVCRRLALLERLCPPAREDLRLGLLSPSVARQLTRLPADNQEEVVQTMRREALTAEEVRGVVDLWQQSAGRAQQEYLLAKPREALRQQHGGTWLRDPRLSPGGNRVAKQLSRTLVVLAAMESWLRHPGLAELRRRDHDLLGDGFVRLAREARAVGDRTAELLEQIDLPQESP
jgi:ParB-like chromosome segregation protein Spo0J